MPTSVAVITVGSGEDRHGATVGSLNALSLDPPLLMFAMKQGSGLLDRLTAGTTIGINLLADRQGTIARRFATPGIDRFEDTHWCEEHALPRIDDTLAWMKGRVSDRLPLGDHLLLTAAIEHGETEDRVPLLYWKRAFYRPGPLESGATQSERERSSAPR
ncbi:MULTISPECIES: flavin reductase family protein [Sinorhizobium/Ensifer group]|uniref:flavin reductase family protein n=1 Tax=Sinorhizobium/Ensifer group TaxID=227292 RepID=UPI0013150160|nr:MULTISPECIES: flavin reductase family protein [Sinorhizobium/Ensifer group]